LAAKPPVIELQRDLLASEPVAVMAQPSVVPPRYLLGVEAAEYMRVDVSTIYRWIKSGQLQAAKVNSRWRVAVADLDGLLTGEAP
jgi:excisionase family DNA binding protein